MADKKNNNSAPFNLSFFEEQSKASQPQTFETYEKPNVSKYNKILQNKGVNSLNTIGKNTKPIKTTHTGLATLQTANTDVIAVVEQYSTNKLTANDLLFLEYTLTQFTAQVHYGEQDQARLDRSRDIALSLEDYMNWRGLTNKKEARKSIKASIEAFYHTSLEWEQDIYEIPLGKKKRQLVRHPFKLRVIEFMDGKLWQNGYAIFTLGSKFAMALSSRETSQIAPTPVALGLIKPNKNPNSFYFAKKLVNHYNMNIGKTNEHIIKVSTLLSSTPAIPNYEDIKEQGRIQQLIINPFERDLDNLADLHILNWHYCNGNNEPLTDEQASIKDYKTFIGLNIYFELEKDQLLDEMREKRLAQKEKARINKEAKELDKADRVAKAQKKKAKE